MSERSGAGRGKVRAAMDGRARELADQLLDAQVRFVLAELTGERLTAVIARDVDDVLALAATLTVAQVVDPERVKSIGRRLVEQIGASPLVEDLVTALSDAIYDLSAAEEHNLGDVVDRDPVEALVAKVLSMHTLHDRALDRMADSPLVATVATRFVSKIVSDFVQQNRQLAERLPGAKSLFSLGSSAASRVRNAPIIGDAAERGTQMAIRRTNSAMRDLIREAPLQGAAMEIWDLHADEPIADLRKYLSRQELRELAVLLREIVISARTSDYADALVDECIDVFFARYGQRDIASLLPELGISRADLVGDLQELLPPVIAAARADGRLEELVRERLRPFFTSTPVLTILAGGLSGRP